MPADIREVPVWERSADERCNEIVEGRLGHFLISSAPVAVLWGEFSRADEPTDVRVVPYLIRCFIEGGRCVMHNPRDGEGEENDDERARPDDLYQSV